MIIKWIQPELVIIIKHYQFWGFANSKSFQLDHVKMMRDCKHLAKQCVCVCTLTLLLSHLHSYTSSFTIHCANGFEYFVIRLRTRRASAQLIKCVHFTSRLIFTSTDRSNFFDVNGIPWSVSDSLTRSRVISNAVDRCEKLPTTFQSINLSITLFERWHAHNSVEMRAYFIFGIWDPVTFSVHYRLAHIWQQSTIYW